MLDQKLYKFINVVSDLGDHSVDLDSRSHDDHR